ncbi:hypothetical protein CLG85_026625 [Yangia mangrovi]|uniref:Uncharacterized protein n=1 Tax=Alloyangia mangrovi TaxID=1779329 RepID=A0A2A3K299_9RHOB|nr:hypothetical protein [Alloyangia mangrovi]MCA0941729.1 hypothetical protein [Alloyangia pacifica]MCA0946893.1 hypothetical protein [Alloyangia pacifica]MCT4373673.1 hypothetical protein [Alloyangia mangrovi]
MPNALHTRPTGRVHVLHVVARDTGLPLLIGGRELTVLASDPDYAARELMRGRNPAHWHVRVTRPGQLPA